MPGPVQSFNLSSLSTDRYGDSATGTVSTSGDTAPIGNRIEENQIWFLKFLRTVRNWIIRYWLAAVIIVCEIVLEVFQLWQVNDWDLLDAMPTISTSMSLLRLYLVWRWEADTVRKLLGNVAYVQAHSIIVALYLSIVTIIKSVFANGNIGTNRAMVLVTVTISTTALAYVLPDVALMWSNRHQPDPNSLKTQLACLAGNVIATMLFAVVERFLLKYLESHLWIMYGMFSVCILSVLTSVYIVVTNNRQNRLLTSRSTAVVLALVICGTKQLVACNGSQADAHDRFVVLHIIINGMNSNIITLQCRRISDQLYENHTRGTLPADIQILELPWRALFTGEQYATTPIWPLIGSVLVQLPFMLLAAAIMPVQSASEPGVDRLIVWLEAVVASPAVSMFHVTLMLYLAHVFMNLLWKMKIEHANLVTPSLVGLSEFLSWGLLALAFMAVRHLCG